MADITWLCEKFDELSSKKVHDILQLRAMVFVVEQNCVFNDVDGSDPDALHFQGTNANGQLVAYTRLFAAGVKYAEVCIGRVVTHPAHRRRGLGTELMRASIKQCHTLFPSTAIRIGAQAHLQGFYGALGFESVAKSEYLEDGIPHIEMLLAAPAPQP